MKLAAMMVSLPLMLGGMQARVFHWTVSGNVQGVEWTEACDLTADAGGKLTGACTSPDGKSKYNTVGTVNGDMVSYSHDGEYEGSALTLSFSGKVATDGSITGLVDVAPNGASGTFNGKPATIAAPVPK